MSTGFVPRASHDLTRVGLTLAPRRGSLRRIVVGVATAGAAFAAGYAGAELLRDSGAVAVVSAPALPSAELVLLRQQLEQARMGLRVADARSQELEKQIDALSHKLTESQDELTFFRKAREGKRH